MIFKKKYEYHYCILHYKNGKVGRVRYCPFNKKIPFLGFDKDWEKEIQAIFWVKTPISNWLTKFLKHIK